jgi:hypothetical protein
MADILETLEIILSKEQAEIFWSIEDNFILLMAGGEGSGKTFLGDALAVAYVEAMTAEKGWSEGHLVWVVGADYEDTRKALTGSLENDWGSIYSFLMKLNILDMTTSSMPIGRDQKAILHTTTGNVYEGISGYDPLKIGRDEPDFIIGEEVSRWMIELWQRCMGRQARRQEKGSKGYYSGSFETSLSWFADKWKEGQTQPNDLSLKSFSVPSWANLSVYPGGREDPAIKRLEASNTPERFMERYGGKPAPPRDAVLPEFRVAHHVAPVEFDPKSPVYVTIDPGERVCAVLFVQFQGDEVWIVDEVYAQRLSHEEVVNACVMKPAWRKVMPYIVMDIAGKQAHFGLGSADEAWRKNPGIDIKMKYIPVDDSVKRLRSVLAVNPVTQRPRLLINPRCSGLISELGGGVSPVEGGGMWRRGINGKPKAENDHACKALAYLLVQEFGTVLPESRKTAYEAFSYLTERRPVGVSYLG